MSIPVRQNSTGSLCKPRTKLLPRKASWPELYTRYFLHRIDIQDCNKPLVLVKDSVLFVCVESAGRSQTAEAFANRYGLSASSAGTVPSARVNPVVVEVMKEKGIDASSNKPKMLTSNMINQASLVVTMGCSVEEVCPRPMLAKMQKKLVDWDLEDPKERPIEEARRIRDEIERKVSELASRAPGPDA